MLFLFNDKQSQIFYQIFPELTSHVVNDGSIIYDLVNNDQIKKYEDNELVFNSTFKIYISNNLISYKDINNDKTYNFSFTTEQIKNIDKIIFKNVYEKINESEFPIFMDSDYDKIFNINFKIFSINPDLFLINEFNNTTLTNKQYFISNKLSDH